MGGNIGTQSSTIMVRGLATGRIEMRQVWTAIFKEVRIALLLGLVYGTLLSIAAWALVASPFGSKSLAHAEAGLVIGFSLFLSMFVAAAIGTLLPVILKKVGLDPARAAGPFVTTTVDVLGTVIYLSMASMMLRR
jgi:magnesium transporter